MQTITQFTDNRVRCAWCGRHAVSGVPLVVWHQRSTFLGSCHQGGKPDHPGVLSLNRTGAGDGRVPCVGGMGPTDDGLSA